MTSHKPWQDEIFGDGWTERRHRQKLEEEFTALRKATESQLEQQRASLALRLLEDARQAEDEENRRKITQASVRAALIKAMKLGSRWRREFARLLLEDIKTWCGQAQWKWKAALEAKGKVLPCDPMSEAYDLVVEKVLGRVPWEPPLADEIEGARQAIKARRGRLILEREATRLRLEGTARKEERNEQAMKWGALRGALIGVAVGFGGCTVLFPPGAIFMGAVGAVVGFVIGLVLSNTDGGTEPPPPRV